MMNSFDTYLIRARIAPAFAALVPLLLTAAFLLPTANTLTLNYLLGAVVISAISLTAAFVGDNGKVIEPMLFNSWGGKPTTILLRHSDRTYPSELKKRYHNNLKKILPDIKIPSANTESRDPSRADQLYEAATMKLIELTTDRQKFPKVFSSNCAYGFRRNLLGLRRIGIFSSIATYFVGIFVYFQQGNLYLAFVALLLGSLGMYMYTALITRRFVREAAFTYARSLIAASDSLT